MVCLDWCESVGCVCSTGVQYFGGFLDIPTCNNRHLGNTDAHREASQAQQVPCLLLAVLMLHTPVTLCGWASGVLKFRGTFFNLAALFSEDNYTCDSQHFLSSVTAEQCLQSEFKCSGNMSPNFRNAKLPQKSTVQIPADRCLILTYGELLYLWYKQKLHFHKIQGTIQCCHLTLQQSNQDNNLRISTALRLRLFFTHAMKYRIAAILQLQSPFQGECLAG